MLRLVMRVGRFVNERSATLAYRLSGSAAHRVAAVWASALQRRAPTVRRARLDWAAGGISSAVGELAAILAAGHAIPIEIASDLESNLCEEQGRRSLSESAAEALALDPEAPLLLYLRVLGLVDLNRFEEAHELVSAALCRLCDDLLFAATPSAHERAQTLISLWKVVNSTARDQMRWVVPEGGGAYGDFDFVRRFETLPAVGGAADHRVILAFAEPYLQARLHEAYLTRCALAFEQARTPFQRLNVVRAMCRQGYRRRLSDYSPAYAMARQFFERCWPEVAATIERVRRGKVRDPRGQLRIMRSALSLAIKLNSAEAAARLRGAMVDFVEGEGGRHGLWMVANALAQSRDTRQRAVDLARGRTVEQEHDLLDFYQFALLTHQYERAHAVFASSDALSRRKTSATLYATILQHCGRFEEAEKLVHSIHAQFLSTADVFDASTSFGLIQRAGELRFAAETARFFASVPQPANPIGVVFVTPRTIEQLRRTPIVVLTEWKRMGWAVVPIYEGVLPLQPTGISRIDRFAGCILASNELRSDDRIRMEPVEPVEVDLETGKLGWRGIDLSHGLWEEAAINRRVYSVVWSCPALRETLRKTVGWTTATAAMLEDARQAFADSGLRVGIQVFSSFRLPDAVVRFYCDAYGDPHDFFCIQTSNGYENYFTNFERNISTRLTTRNMTAHPGTRSSSMPLASHVMRAVAEDRASVERSTEILLRTARSKPHGHAFDPAREEAHRRIAQWRSSGGRVACAFGKVVCDSGVPFDGGPAHVSMKDWILHTIEAVRGSRTLLLVKPHPHELREEVACFLNETFRDLLPRELPSNVLYLDHDWFETHELEGLIDLALIYNGTTAVEMALLGVPTVLMGHFGPVDYPMGQAVPADREDYRRLVRFEREVTPLPEGPMRAAAWLSLMASDDVSVPYRYHSRQITNCTVYPPFWFRDDIDHYLDRGDPNVTLLADRAVSVN